MMDYRSAFDYKSMYSYGKNVYNDNDPYGSEKFVAPQSNTRESFQFASLFTTFATFFCYTIVVLTFPVAFIFYLKRVKPFEKAVVFRLGKVRSAEGPGMILVLPFVDKYMVVNLQETDIDVPAQQFLSSDNAVVQCGARIRFRISNPILYSTSYYDPHYEGLRSLVKSVLLKVGGKHKQRDFEPESNGKDALSESISKEMNGQVNMWGIEIVTTFISDVAVIKPAEQKNALQPVLNCLLGGSGGPAPVSQETSKSLISNLMNIHKNRAPSVAAMVPPPERRGSTIRQRIEKLLQDGSKTQSGSLHTPGENVLKLEISYGDGSVETMYIDLAGMLLPSPVPHQVSIECREETAVALLDRKLSPTSAIFGNQVQVNGDVGLLKKFIDLL